MKLIQARVANRYGGTVGQFEGTPYFLLTRLESQSMYLLFNQETNKVNWLSPNRDRSIAQAIEIIGGQNV